MKLLYIFEFLLGGFCTFCLKSELESFVTTSNARVLMFAKSVNEEGLFNKCFAHKRISLWTPPNIPHLTSKLHRELSIASQIIGKLAENIY